MKRMKKKILNYPMLPFKSFSNFMVKEQMLSVLPLSKTEKVLPDKIEHFETGDL